MKKYLALILALAMALSLLAGCSKGITPANNNDNNAPAATGTAAIESFKTIGDVLAATGDSGETQTATTEKYHVRVFKIDNTYYRVIAEAPADVSQAIFDLDYADPDHDKKLDELSSPLKIIKYENLSDMIPTQAELDKYVGKTAQDLFDDEWYSGGWNLEDMVFYMDKAPFAYEVVLEGLDSPDVENFDEEDMGPLVVKSVTFSGLGDATALELDEDGNMIG